MKYGKIYGLSILAALVAAGTLLPCTGGGSSQDLPAGDWIEHGLNAEQREELRSFFEEAVEKQDVAGCALLLIRDDEVVFREAFGFADLATKRAFTIEQPCFIASVTKSVTSTLMVILDENRVVRLNDPVKKWVPSFRGIKIRGQETLASSPKIWECLAHLSGLPGNADLNPRDGKFQGSLSEAVDGFAEDGLMGEPGTRWSYSQAGYMTAARAAENATGQPFEVILKELLLDPLGMTSTTFHPSKAVSRKLPRAYYRGDDGLVPGISRFSESSIGDLIDPGSGLFSTLDDMGRFLLFHLNRGVVDGKRLVSVKALARMYRTPVRFSVYNYGLGFNIDDGGVRHLGGSGTMVWIDFEKGMAGVLLTQTAWRGNSRFQRSFDELIRDVFHE